MKTSTLRAWTAAALLALATGGAAAALSTASLDAVVAEIEARLAVETDAKRTKALQAVLKALTGPKKASLPGDLAALKAAAAKLPKLRLEDDDALFDFVDEAFGRLRAEGNAEISRVYAQILAQDETPAAEAARKPYRAARDAMDRAGDEELTPSARYAALKKVFSLVAAARKKLKVVGSSPCDSGGFFAATVDGGRVTTLQGGGEISSKLSGEITHVGLIGYTYDPATVFTPYWHFLSIDFAGASFQGVGTYAVTKDGPVRGSYVRDKTEQFDAVEGSVTITVWDPATRRVEGTFSFRAEHEVLAGVDADVTDGTFLACKLNAFTSP